MSHTHTHTHTDTVPTIPAVYLAILSSWSYSRLHINVEQKSSILFLFVSSNFLVSSLSPLRLWDLVQKEMLVRWLIRALERQMGFLSVRETQCYSTRGLNAQYLIPLFLPSASSHIPTQSPGRRTGRHHLWVGPMLYEYTMPSL